MSKGAKLQERNHGRFWVSTEEMWQVLPFCNEGSIWTLRDFAIVYQSLPVRATLPERPSTLRSACAARPE